ncbi:Unknown protein sequence [Pseudomonas syringae pv. maculicola]|nr:Unknown protein sequence [Pseudomonas syringae pv. maculicola]
MFHDVDVIDANIGHAPKMTSALRSPLSAFVPKIVDPALGKTHASF